jgi:hypothetical protein
MKLETLESNSTSMSSEEWCKRDSFILRLFSSTLLMARGFEGLEEVLGVIESLDVDLRPDKIHHLRPKRKYSRQLLRERLQEAYVGDVFHMMLGRTKPSGVTFTLASAEYETGPRSSVELSVDSFDFFREPGRGERRAEQIVSFVRALAAHLPLFHGLGHSFTDFHLSSDPIATDPHAGRRSKRSSGSTCTVRSGWSRSAANACCPPPLFILRSSLTAPSSGSPAPVPWILPPRRPASLKLAPWFTCAPS